MKKYVGMSSAAVMIGALRVNYKKKKKSISLILSTFETTTVIAKGVPVKRIIKKDNNAVNAPLQNKILS